MLKKVACSHRRAAARLATLLAALAAFAPAVRASDQIIDFDHAVDFAAVHTFALRGTSIQIDRPELRTPLVVQDISGTVRAALLARGLKEAANDADVLVDWTVSGQRFAINEWRNAVPLDDIPGERPLRGNPWRNLPESFVEGALTVDLTARSSGLLIWRGVYRNREDSSGKLAHELAGYAKKLLAGYPPRRK